MSTQKDIIGAMKQQTSGPSIALRLSGWRILQKLAKFVGRRDDLGDGELHRLCVAARATPPIVPFRKVLAKI